MESVRRATPADLDRLVELHAAALDGIADQRGGAIHRLQRGRVDPEAGLSRALDDPDHLVLVGEVEGWVAGYCVTRVERLSDGSSLGVIDDLWVEPDAREVGVGEVMLDRVLGWCEERGCRGVDALALPGDRHTKNFFETQGLTARAIVVHRSLEAPGDAGS